MWRLRDAGDGNTECKWFSVCPMRLFYQQGEICSYWIETYCHGNWRSCLRYWMEERGAPHPDNMLPNGETYEDLS